MKLASLLDKSRVLCRIRAATKAEAIREILDTLQDRDALAGVGASADDLLDELLARESKGSTGLGGGVGYPHARRAGFGDFLLALATAPQGIDYGAPDGQPVAVVLLAVVPPEKSALLLGVMACLSHLVEDAGLVESLVRATDRDDVWELLARSGLEVKDSVTARDIMKRDVVTASPEMTLADIAALMHREHVNVLPVLDNADSLVGQVSAHGLFAACMPPYFAELPSMKFATDFDAFEHFFQKKAHLRVADILDEEVLAVEAETPLAELIARLARVGVRRLYVAEQGRLLGVIDSFSIIDKVLSI